MKIQPQLLIRGRCLLAAQLPQCILGTNSPISCTGAVAMVPTTAGDESLWGVLSTAPWSWETTNSQAHTHSHLLSKWQRFSHRWRRAGLFQARRGQCGIAQDPGETGCVSCRAGRWLQQRCPDTDPSWDHLLACCYLPGPWKGGWGGFALGSSCQKHILTQAASVRREHGVRVQEQWQSMFVTLLSASWSLWYHVSDSFWYQLLQARKTSPPKIASDE